MRYLLLPLIIFGVVLATGGYTYPSLSIPPGEAQGAPAISEKAQSSLTTAISEKAQSSLTPAISAVDYGPPLIDFSLESLGPAEPPADLIRWQEFLGPVVGATAYNLAEQYQIPQLWARRLVWRESKGDPNLDSPTHDHGLMQLNDATWPWLAKRVGIMDPDPHDPVQNLQMGFWYLNYLHQKYGDWDSTLTAYNRGEGGLQTYVASRGTPRSSYSNFIMRESGH